MSNSNDLNPPTYFEERRTKFNSMHQIDEERVSGCQPVQQNREKQCLTAPSPRFPPSPRQYGAHEFGLCEDEEFRHPRMFENLAYETDAEAFEAMRAENARPPYQQQPRFNVCDLPSEQLEDFSSPQFSGAYDEDECNACPQQQQTPNLCDISAPDFCDVSDASPWPDQTPSPRRAQSPTRQQQRQQYTSECLDDQSAPVYESPVGSPTPQVHYTPIRLLETPDVCAPSPPAPTPTSPPHFSPIRFQPSPVQYPSECLEDVTVPSFARTPCDMPTPPSPGRVQMPQDLPSDMVCDASAPSFRSPPTPSVSFPSEALDEMTMPSFENASCGSPLGRRFLLDSRLADESPPTFDSFGASSSRRTRSRRDETCEPLATPQSVCPTQRSVCPPSNQYESTPMRKRMSPPRRFNLAQLMAQHMTTSGCPPMQTSCPSSAASPTTAPHFSFYSPTPVGDRSLPTECLTDISEPTFFDTSYRGSPHTRQFPESLPSECLGDITEPSYQMTPPAPTPPLPCDLPSEQICDMSQPMYDSPRSERLSSISMPTFEDTSCGSPLDRRFLLDSRIMDESPPSFASSMPSSPRISSPCRSPSPCVQPRERTATPQRNQPSPRFSPSPIQRSRSPSPVCLPTPTPPAPHFSLCSPTPLRSPPMRSMPTDLSDECLANISEPAFFNTPPKASPARRYFPSNMTNECLADISAPSYEMTPPPRTPSMPHDLPSELICDMSPPMYQSPASEHLSGESMPSFADTSCGSPLDRRFLLDPYLEDESMPTMVSAGSRSVSPERCKPGATGTSSFDETYCEILQRFNALKGKVECASPGSPSASGAAMPSGECIRETVIERTENENGQLESTTQHIVVTIDPRGSIKTHTKEVKTQLPHQTPRRLLPPSADSGVLTQSPRPASQIESLRNCIRRRLDFDISDMPSENLADMSMPCADDLPSMSTENILQHLSSVPEEQLTNVSAPSFRSPPILSPSYTSEILEQMSMPSFENTSCGSPLDRRFLLDPRLADESPLTFVSSYVSSPQTSYATTPSVPTASGYTPYMHSRPPAYSPQRAFVAETARTPSPRRFSLRPSPRREYRSPTPVTPQAPHFSLHSPTPIGSPPGRSFPTNLPSEQLTDISEPAFFSGPPRASPQRRSLPRSMPSERLEDISQPSYQKTPPPRTPGIPTNLPSEMLGNVSAPSYRSPASEHISSVSMPSFPDISYESPLDRRFLLDARLADESMPSLPRTPSTNQSPSSPRPGEARRRLSYSQPDSTRGSVRRDDTARSRSEGRKDFGEHGPGTVEQTRTTIKQSGTYQQQQRVTPGRKGSSQTMIQGQRQQSPLVDALREELKTTTSIHSITHIYPQTSRASPPSGQARRRSMSLPSENLGDISMPSMGLSTAGPSQQHRMQFSTQNLDDISMPSGPPSMGMSTTGRSQLHRMSPTTRNLNDISMPSGPPSTFMSTPGRISPRTRRQRSVQNVNDISPISFATTISSTNISGSSPDRETNSKKYRSTSSKGLSGLKNYAPFFEQIRSRNNSGTCDSYDPCSPCCPTVQNNDRCDPCAGFSNLNRSNKSNRC